MRLVMVISHYAKNTICITINIKCFYVNDIAIQIMRSIYDETPDV